MICRGLCACTEMLWMCVLYVSFGSKVRPRTFGCVAMGSALLFIVRSRLLVYSAGSGVNLSTSLNNASNGIFYTLHSIFFKEIGKRCHSSIFPRSTHQH